MHATKEYYHYLSGALDEIKMQSGQYARGCYSAPFLRLVHCTVVLGQSADCLILGLNVSTKESSEGYEILQKIFDSI